MGYDPPRSDLKAAKLHPAPAAPPYQQQRSVRNGSQFPSLIVLPGFVAPGFVAAFR
jgi:hypothetical protein